MPGLSPLRILPYSLFPFPIVPLIERPPDATPPHSRCSLHPLYFLPPPQLKKGFVATCQAYPRSDCTILLHQEGNMFS